MTARRQTDRCDAWLCPLCRWRSVPRRRDVFQFLQPLQSLGSPQGLVIDAGGVQAAARLVGVLLKVRKELFDLLLDRYKEPEQIGVSTDVHP
jgi:hypothetical protein